MRIIVLTFFALASACVAQHTGCDAAEATQLDFWVGTWDLTWPATDDDPGRGTNTITREHGGCVIHERFASESGLEGESVSVYSPRAGWRQTWVDNQGGYLLFTGTLAGGEREFRTAPFTNAQGQEQISRMTWRNVTADTLDWHWQRSSDGGVTWEDAWVIRYARR